MLVPLPSGCTSRRVFSIHTGLFVTGGREGKVCEDTDSEYTEVRWEGLEDLGA